MVHAQRQLPLKHHQAHLTVDICTAGSMLMGGPIRLMNGTPGRAKDANASSLAEAS